MGLPVYEGGAACERLNDEVDSLVEVEDQILLRHVINPEDFVREVLCLDQLGCCYLWEAGLEGVGHVKNRSALDALQRFFVLSEVHVPQEEAR